MLPKEKTIQTREQLNEWIKYEKNQYGNRSFLHMVFPVSERDVLQKHQIVLRKAEYYTNRGKKILRVLYKIRLLRIQNRYALHIPMNCCGKGLKIMHVGPILLNGRASVGENCAFHINSALVAKGVSDDAPVLGNNVVVGVGAVVVGGVVVADSVAIGANSVVTKDICEQNIAIAGAPAKKVSDNGRLKW